MMLDGQETATLARFCELVVPGSTIVSFAAGMVDAAGRPLWGGDLTLVAHEYLERRRMADALAFTTEVLRAAGAKRVVWSGLSTSHVRGTARMGADPNRSVADNLAGELA